MHRGYMLGAQFGSRRVTVNRLYHASNSLQVSTVVLHVHTHMLRDKKGACK